MSLKAVLTILLVCSVAAAYWTTIRYLRNLDDQ